MAMEIKTLASGTLRNSTAAFLAGGLVLYAAPHPSESLFLATAKKAAMVTTMRFFNKLPYSGFPSGGAQLSLHFVRYVFGTEAKDRLQTRILPFLTTLRPRELRVETTPLVLEEGDLIIGSASLGNWVDYVISGIEREV